MEMEDKAPKSSKREKLKDGDGLASSKHRSRSSLGSSSSHHEGRRSSSSKGKHSSTGSRGRRSGESREKHRSSSGSKGRRSGESKGRSSSSKQLRSSSRNLENDQDDSKSEKRAKNAEGGSGSGSSRAREREERAREEREAKEKARPRTSQSPRSHRRNSGGDEKAAYRRSNSGVSLPGAQLERSSSGRSRQRDEKATYRLERSSRSVATPGAQSESSSRDRARRKGERNKRNQEPSIPIASMGRRQSSTAPPDDNGDGVVTAVTVDEDARRREEEARLRKMFEEENEKRRHEEAREKEASDKKADEAMAELARTKRKRKRCIMMVCIFFMLLAIGGGVAAFFLTRGDNKDEPNGSNIEPEVSDGIPSEASANPSGYPSFNPTDKLSESFVYKKPSLEECRNIASGAPIEGEDEMFVQNIDLLMQVELSNDSNIDELVPELQTKIEKLLVPDLIGCPRDVFLQRRLGKTANAIIDRSHRRLRNIRYAVAKAAVAVTVAEDDCQDSSSSNCRFLTVSLDLRLRGDEKFIFLAAVIVEVFPNGEDISQDLQLTDPFEAVVVKLIRPHDPTTAPSISPSGLATPPPTSPMSLNNPSQGPALRPTTPGPAKSPTKAPTASPTKKATAAPTPTPPPTLAPQPGRTPPPTKLPTARPTPTPPPTFAPQPGITPRPTPPPTIAPTIAASENPTFSPTIAPTSSPSPEPTIRSSAAPSTTPTSGPTSSPTSPRPTSTYLGCFEEGLNYQRDLELEVKNEMDVEGCRTICKNFGYPYASLQEGSYCFCGSNYGIHGESDGCNTGCINQSDSYCGGVGANSVYLTGAPIQSVPALENDLYCDCTRDVTVEQNRDLPHRAPYENLSEKACIRYCKSEGYDFAGLQYNVECFCGDSPGSYSFSDLCDDSIQCLLQEPAACYDGSSSCGCGGTYSQSLYRTSRNVACPVRTEASYAYLGCFTDNEDRVMDLVAIVESDVEECVSVCKGLGFPYAGLQAGQWCLCGNQYNALGTSEACTVPCSDGSACGGPFANSVYTTGSSSSAGANLDADLYCGCSRDTEVRDLEHQAPYALSQNACIHYCRSNNYQFAGMQYGDQCYCGNTAGSYGGADNCDRQCPWGEPQICNNGARDCICGGDFANSLYRTSQAVSCPSLNMYLGCYTDNADRVFELLTLDIVAKANGRVEDCVSFCDDLGFPYAGMQVGKFCYCGNQYDTLGTSNGCSMDCPGDGGECGGPWANSVYATGLTSSALNLDANLYCGCFRDTEVRDMEHLAPYLDLSQASCIHYCRANNYKFAGMQHDACFCDNTAGSYGVADNCDRECAMGEPQSCYAGTDRCTCGGDFANSLYRTSQVVACPI